MGIDPHAREPEALIKPPANGITIGDGDTPPRKNPMALAESFLDLLARNARGYRDFGLPVAVMRRALQKAIDAYYAAELAGDRAAMAVAKGEADRLLKESMEGTFTAVAAGLLESAN